MLRRFWTAGVFGLFLVSFGALTGCGDKAGPGSGATSSGAKDLVVQPGQLPELGPYVPGLDKDIPGLDEDRLKAAPPKGWLIPPRKGQVVVWFKESSKNDYPQILVTAEDFDAVMNVTKDNAAEFAKALSAEFRKKNPASKTPVTTLQVGDFHGATYRRYGKATTDFKEVELERLIVETAVDGRKYAFELRTYPGDVEKYSQHLYAVVHGAKFINQGPGEPPPAVEKPQPAEKPEEKPEVKPETKPEEKPEAKPETKPDDKPEVKPETKPEVKPEPKPVEKPKKKKPSDFEIEDEELK